MKRFLWVIILVVACRIVASAETITVSGHVYLHDKTMPLAFAIVESSNPKQKTTTDSVGYYNIQTEANDSLVFSYLGCKSKQIAVTKNGVIDVYLENEATNLTDVEIVAKGRPFRLSPNGIDVNMNVVKHMGKPLSDVLPLLPYLSLDNNNIKMVGKNGVIVYLNHHQVYLKGEELISYLNAIGVENIKRIHIVTNPSAQYDASDNIGFLEIETSSKEGTGLQTRILARATAAHDLTYGTSINLLYSGKNFSIGNILLGSSANNFVENNYTNVFSRNTVSTNNKKRDKELVVTTLTTAYWTISPKNNLSATLQLPWYNRDKTHDITNDTKYYSEGHAGMDSVMTSKGVGRSKNYQLNGELNYLHKFNDSANYNITIGFISDYTNNYRGWTSVTNSSTNTITEDLHSAGNQKYNIYTARIDFNHMVKDWQLSEGYKFSYTHTNSYNEDNEMVSADHLTENSFGYRELNQALYVSAERSMKSVSVNLGLRIEFTRTKGLSYSLNTTNTEHYAKLFPTLGVEYAINDDNDLTFNYAGRIKRPEFHLLDPFRWYTSKYDYSEGNPFLKPSYIHDLSIGYTYKNAIFTKLYFTRTLNDFGYMVFLDADNIQNQVERAGNYLNITEAGFNAEYNFNIGTWLEAKLAGEVSYANYTSKVSTFRNITGWGGSLSMNTSFHINQKFIATVDAENSLPGYYNYRKTHNALIANIGLLYNDMKSGLVIQLKFEDLFKAANPKYSYYSNGVNQLFDNYYDTRCLQLTMIKKFGKTAKKNSCQFQSSNSEERDRL